VIHGKLYTGQSRTASENRQILLIEKRKFFTPAVFYAPLKVLPSEFRNIVWVQKARMMALPMAQNVSQGAWVSTQYWHRTGHRNPISVIARASVLTHRTKLGCQ